MNKIIISFMCMTLVLNAADGLTVEQKQKILLDQLVGGELSSEQLQQLACADEFQKFSLIKLWDTYNIPDKPCYEISKKEAQETLRIIQESGTGQKNSIVQAFAIWDIHAGVRCQKTMQGPFAGRLYIQEIMEKIDMPQYAPRFVAEIKKALYAYQLQQQLQVPQLTPEVFEHLYREKISKRFEILKQVVREGKLIAFDQNVCLPQLPPEPIQDQEMNELVKLYIKTSKEVLQQELFALSENPLRDLSQLMGKFVRPFSK